MSLNFKKLHKIDNNEEKQRLKENLRIVAVNLHGRLNTDNALLTRDDVRLLYDVDDVHRYLPSHYKPIFQEFRTINVEDNTQKEVYSRAMGIGFSGNLDLPSTREVLAFALGCDEKEVSINAEDLNSKKKVYYNPSSFSHFYKNTHLNKHGSVKDKYLLNSHLNIELNTIKGVNFPEVVLNEFYLTLNSINEDVFLPKRVNGSCIVNLKSVNSIQCPEYVGQHLDLRNLEEVGTLILPEFVRQSINLNGLRNFNKIIFPLKMGEFSGESEIKMGSLDESMKKQLREQNSQLIIV